MHANGQIDRLDGESVGCIHLHSHTRKHTTHIHPLNYIQSAHTFIRKRRTNSSSRNTTSNPSCSLTSSHRERSSQTVAQSMSNTNTCGCSLHPAGCMVTLTEMRSRCFDHNETR